ncbi:formyl transferase [Pisolithus albus]|nr:formyl transferase [Pisolithus albus]
MSASDPPPRRLAVLISGSGTNLQALIDAQNTPALPNTSIVLVLSNRKAAHGLVRATSASPPIPTAYLALQPYLRHNPGKTREDYDLELARIVVRAKPDVVVLAGWMHIVSESFLEVLRGHHKIDEDDENPVSTGPIPVINIHPALPGQFDGANAIQRGYEAFQRGEVDRLGVMVHRVVAEVDRGEPLIVREVPIEKGESIEVYEERLHRVEWEIIVQATKRVLDEVKPMPPPEGDGIDSDNRVEKP